MAAERTAEEAKAHCISAMGQDLGEVYAALWQETALLFRNWNEYVDLFGSKPSRVDLLNRAAGSFFRIVQDALWEQTVLHVARLTDPAASVGRSNLSIRRLLECIDDAEIKSLVAPTVDAALEAARFCRDWRNRHIAHRDLDLALERAAEPLAAGTLEKVRQALDRLADVLNAVSRRYLDSETHFDGHWYAGGQSLLHVLDRGVEAEEQRRQRIKAGQPLPDYFRRRDL